jgi:hypothetical protein
LLIKKRQSSEQNQRDDSTAVQSVALSPTGC